MTPTEDHQHQQTAAETLTALAEVPAERGRAVVSLIKMLAEHPEHAGYLKDLIEAERNRDLFDQDWRTAKVFAASGKFDDIKGATQEQAIATAMAKIRIGREWGMSDADAIAQIYFVNGRPAVMTEFLASRMQEAGYSWDADWEWAEEVFKGKTTRKCVGCTLWLKRGGEPCLDRNGKPISASFTEADAERAVQYDRAGKASSLLDKQTYKSYAQDMFFWKALGRLRKYYLTGVLRGAVQVELARELPPRETLQIEAAESPAAAAAEPKPLRERVLEYESAEDQGSLLDEADRDDNT